MSHIRMSKDSSFIDYSTTRVLWEATLGAEEWFGGSEQTARRLSLKPDDMQASARSCK